MLRLRQYRGTKPSRKRECEQVGESAYALYDSKLLAEGVKFLKYRAISHTYRGT